MSPASSRGGLGGIRLIVLLGGNSIVFPPRGLPGIRICGKGRLRGTCLSLLSVLSAVNSAIPALKRAKSLTERNWPSANPALCFLRAESRSTPAVLPFLDRPPFLSYPNPCWLCLGFFSPRARSPSRGFPRL